MTPLQNQSLWALSMIRNDLYSVWQLGSNVVWPLATQPLPLKTPFRHPSKFHSHSLLEKKYVVNRGSKFQNQVLCWGKLQALAVSIWMAFHFVQFNVYWLLTLSRKLWLNLLISLQLFLFCRKSPCPESTEVWSEGKQPTRRIKGKEWRSLKEWQDGFPWHSVTQGTPQRLWKCMLKMSSFLCPKFCSLYITFP